MLNKITQQLASPFSKTETTTTTTSPVNMSLTDDLILIHRLLDTQSDVLDYSIDQAHDGPVQLNRPSNTVLREFTEYLDRESAWNLFTDCITSPSSAAVALKRYRKEQGNGDNDDDDDDEDDERVDPNTIRRSFRAMMLLLNDMTSYQRNVQEKQQLEQLSEQQRQQYQEILLQQGGGLIDDLDSSIVSPIRANLLAKKLFQTYHDLAQQYIDAISTGTTRSGTSTSTITMTTRVLAHLPHLNQLLQRLLHTFPNSVIAASAVHGKEGIATSLGSLLSLIPHVPQRESPLGIFCEIVICGCTGQLDGGNISPTTSTINTMQDESQAVTKATRRKFVHGVLEYKLVTKIVEDLVLRHPESEEDFGSENATDALIRIVERIAFPPLLTPQQQLEQQQQGITTPKLSEIDSMGEEGLLAPLKEHALIETLLVHSSRNYSNADAVTQVLLGLFEICTGKARRMASIIPQENLEEEDVECKMTSVDPIQVPGVHDNKLHMGGWTRSIHETLVQHVSKLVEVMDLNVALGETDLANVENGNHIVAVKGEQEAVSHPGRYTIERPFTSRRLHLITLLADILSFEDHTDSLDSNVGNKSGNLSVNTRTASSSNCTAQAALGLEALMALPVHPTFVSNSKKKHSEKNIDTAMDAPNDLVPSAYNPWPALCELVFQYPENSMYQFQFYRLLHALCRTNHEPTLKLVVQRCKFLSRAIRAFRGGVVDSGAATSNRGVLLRCLNALRLHSQSLSQHSFLRHYLESHDGWKVFQDDLKQ